ncbi:MAG TPA: carbonic anhydrase [Acidimicrobiales bacterium]|nr:carbonic anhydrase [Acidimicrobiales bacterium]
MPLPTLLHEAHARARAAAEASTDGAVPEHRPVAAVLTCSDARVSPARLFDLPPGSLFVVRVAGNIATPEAVASLTYAVEHLDVDTVIVLGHTHCGAVTAALAGDEQPALAPLVDPIRPTVSEASCVDLTCAVPANVVATVQALGTGDGPLARAIREGRVDAYGAVLDLIDQSITPIPTHPTPEPMEPIS